MKIAFIVGKAEQHEMELSFDQKTGDLRVLMDGTPVLREEARLARNPMKRYELSIGNSEKHSLALLLTYGHDDEPGAKAMPRLSMKLTALAAPEAVSEALPLDNTDSFLAANAAVTV